MVDEYHQDGGMIYRDDEEDLFFDRSVMNKPLIAIVKELKNQQRFDEKVFNDAGALFYEIDELTVKEGVLDQVC